MGSHWHIDESSVLQEFSIVWTSSRNVPASAVTFVVITKYQNYVYSSSSLNNTRAIAKLQDRLLFAGLLQMQTFGEWLEIGGVYSQPSYSLPGRLGKLSLFPVTQKRH